MLISCFYTAHIFLSGLAFLPSSPGHDCDLTAFAMLYFVFLKDGMCATRFRRWIIIVGVQKSLRRKLLLTSYSSPFSSSSLYLLLSSTPFHLASTPTHEMERDNCGLQSKKFQYLVLDKVPRGIAAKMKQPFVTIRKVLPASSIMTRLIISAFLFAH